MKLFHNTNYKIYNKNLSKNLRILIVNDLHFSSMITDKKLDKISNKIKELKPDYILFPGDIIDSLDSIEDTSEYIRLLSWINGLGKVIMSLGGHDFYECDSKIRKYKNPLNLVKGINSLSNAYLLDNSKYEDKNVFITGYTQSMEYYNYPNNNSRIFHPVKENKKIMKKELKSLNEKIGKVPKNKISILLAHSPVYLLDKNIQKEIKSYNYYVSGHMHNGCVPPLLYELWNSKKGLIAPCKEFFPDNERNTLRKYGDKLIVNGPLTMFASRKLNFFNIFYPLYITTVDFTCDSKYKNKLVIKRKYTK